jgi:hypothetical protein
LRSTDHLHISTSGALGHARACARQERRCKAESGGSWGFAQYLRPGVSSRHALFAAKNISPQKNNFPLLFVWVLLFGCEGSMSLTTLHRRGDGAPVLPCCRHRGGRNRVSRIFPLADGDSSSPFPSWRTPLYRSIPMHRYVLHVLSRFVRPRPLATKHEPSLTCCSSRCKGRQPYPPAAGAGAYYAPVSDATGPALRRI